MTAAPIFLILPNSLFTSFVSRLNIILSGFLFFPRTLSCGPIVMNPLPVMKAQKPFSDQSGFFRDIFLLKFNNFLFCFFFLGPRECCEKKIIEKDDGSVE